MHKHIVILQAAPGHPPAAIEEAWSFRSRSLSALPPVRRLVSNRVLETLSRGHAPQGPLDPVGIEEVWLDRDPPREVLTRLAGSGPGGLQVAAAFAVEEVPIFERAIPATHKRITLLRRRDDLSLAAFSAYWREVHAPMARCHRFVTRYAQNHRLPDGCAPAGAGPVDGVAEFLIADLARMQEDYESEEGRRMRADVANFAGALTTCLVRPIEVKPLA